MQDCITAFFFFFFPRALGNQSHVPSLFSKSVCPCATVWAAGRRCSPRAWVGRVPSSPSLGWGQASPQPWATWPLWGMPGTGLHHPHPQSLHGSHLIVRVIHFLLSSPNPIFYQWTFARPPGDIMCQVLSPLLGCAHTALARMTELPCQQNQLTGTEEGGSLCRLCICILLLEEIIYCLLLGLFFNSCKIY